MTPHDPHARCLPAAPGRRRLLRPKTVTVIGAATSARATGADAAAGATRMSTAAPPLRRARANPRR